MIAVSDLKRIITSAKYYKGPIDNNLDPQFMVALQKVLVPHEKELTGAYASWGAQRMATAAAQLILNHAGYDAGAVDGLYGNQTAGAFLEWNHFESTGSRLVLPKRPIITVTGQQFKDVPLQKECNAYYGRPADQVESRLVSIDVPYVMWLEYDPKQRIRTIQIHEKAATSMEFALNEIAGAYTAGELRRYKLDQFAGSYNKRFMRGSKSWSMHAYGCAADFNSTNNGLTTKCPAAQFCADEYVPFFDIWEKYGWISLGRVIGRDWMHVQRARLS